MIEKWQNRNNQGRLDTYESPMDLEAAWDDLELRRKPKKKRRILILFFFCSLALLSWYFVEKSCETQLPLDKKRNIAQDELQLPEAIFKENGLSTDVFQGDTIGHSIVVKANDENPEEGLLRRNKSGSSKTFSISENSVLPLKTKVLFDDSADEISFSSYKSEEKNATQNPTVKVEKVSKGKITIEPLPRLAVRFISLAEQNESDLISQFSTLEIEDLGQSDKLKGAKNSIGFAGGYSWLTSGDAYGEEMPLDAGSLALFYERSISKQLYFKTGIGFQQFTNQTKIKDENNYSNLENDVIAINYYKNGRVEEVRGDVEVSYQETKEFHLYNRYRFVNFSFLPGYKIEFDNKSTLKIECGASVSLFSKPTGSIYKDDLVYVFEALSDFESRSFGILQGLGGVYYSRNLGTRFSLLLGTQFNYHLNSAVALAGEKGRPFSSLGFVIGGQYGL